MEEIIMKNDTETKREKFVRIAERRTNKIIDQLELLSNLSNTSAYEYSQKDVEKIFSAIQYQLNESKKAFLKTGNQGKERFKLD